MIKKENDLRFAWDSKKAAINQKKHKIDFEEGSTVFYDENALLIYDPDHSETEDRFIILGISKRTRLLVVCHCYPENANLIRIISARKATKKEAAQYAEVLR